MLVHSLSSDERRQQPPQQQQQAQLQTQLQQSTSSSVNNAAATYPSSIEDYQLVGQLGKGAFGTVYEARLHSQGADSYTSPLAIKALSKTLIRTKGLAARVRNEVTIHYQLRHSNVLELVHFFEDDTSVYLVLEYAAGGELYRKVRAGSLSLAQIRSIFAAIVEGLAYLHSHGIIHRDLKLSNILLATDLTPKIADFGLAVKVEEEARDGEQQTLCGTPNYLAPEVILKSPYGREADIWSLGCLLYSMLVGRAPFESVDIRETFARVRRGDFMIPSTVPPLAADLVRQLIVLDPGRRLSLDHIRRHPFLYPPVPMMITGDATLSSSLSPPVGRSSSLSMLALTTPTPSSNYNALMAAHSPPLLAKRCRPLQQRLRHGLLQITEQGELLIDFAPAYPDVMLVSGDGLLIHLYARPFVPGSLSVFATRSSSSVAPLPVPLHSFRYPNLPSGVRQRYEYGRRFVNLVRGKSPQMILLTDAIKAFLMDNPDGGSPNFQLRLVGEREGGLYRLDYAPRQEEFIIKNGNAVEARYVGISHANAWRVKNDHHRVLISECLLKYQQCIQALAKETNGSFPRIIDERTLRARNQQQPSSNDLHHEAVHQTNEYQSGDLTIPQLTRLISAGMASMHEQGKGTLLAERSTMLEYTFHTFLPGIGYCLASAAEQFLLLFLDGDTVLIDGRRNRVCYHDRHEAGTPEGNRWLYIDQQLPAALKRKLTYFPQFVHLLKAGQGHTFVES